MRLYQFKANGVVQRWLIEINTRRYTYRNAKETKDFLITQVIFQKMMHIHVRLKIVHFYTFWILLKKSQLKFSILAFTTIFCHIKAEQSSDTVWRQVSGFQKLAKLAIFGIFNELLSTQNLNVALFARNVEWDFFCDFQQQTCN